MELPDDFPTNLLEFDQKFADEDACRAYLLKLRWPDGFCCPACRGRRGWQLARGNLFECASCSRQTSLTAGTVLHGTRKPLRWWFKAMCLVVSQKLGLSAKNFMRLMGIASYETAWRTLHKLRRAMVREGRPQLEGKVEVDESIIGGVVEGACGRGSPNPVVVAAVERLDGGGTPKARLGRVRLKVVEDASAPSLFTFVRENVRPGTIVLTDGWPGYNELRDVGFQHLPHAQRTPKNAAKFLPGVHRVFSLAKRWLLGTHQGSVAPKHLQWYLDEYTFRFNRRRSSHPFKLFHRLAQQVVITPPTTYREIVGSPNST